MTFHRSITLLYCLMLFSSNALAQQLSVANYLDDPTKTNARKIARQSPEILEELISKFESADDDSVRLACLTAINASVTQTEQSRKFLAAVADSKKVSEHLVAVAKFGVSMNRLPTDEAGAKQKFVIQCNQLAIQQRFWIGDRYDELMVEFSSEKSSDVLMPLIGLVAQNASPTEAEDFANYALNQYFRQISNEPDECTDDEIHAIIERVEVAVHLSNMENDRLFRKWLTKTLEQSDGLPHLAVNNSRKIAIIRMCLGHFLTHEMLKSDFDRLKTLTPKEIFKTGRDEREVALIFTNKILELVKHQPETYDYENDDNPQLIKNFADLLACEVLPPFLVIDLEECRNAETRAVAQQAMSIVQERKSITARKVYISLADTLIKTGEDKRIAMAMDLLSNLAPTGRDRRFIERMAYGITPASTPFVQTKATALLAIWDQNASNTSQSNTTLEGFLTANWSNLEFEQQIELTKDLAVVERGAGVRMIIQLIAIAKTPEEKFRLIETAAYELGLPNDNRARLTKIECEQIYPVASIVFDQLGAMENRDDNETTVSFAKAVAFDNPDGQRVLETFISRSNNETAKQIAGSLIWKNLNDKLDSAVLEVGNFYLKNSDLDLYNRSEMNWYQNLQPIIQISLDAKGGSTAIQRENFRVILEAHSLLMKKLKTISSDDKHELQTWAKETLEQHEK